MTAEYAHDDTISELFLLCGGAIIYAPPALAIAFGNTLAQHF